MPIKKHNISKISKFSKKNKNLKKSKYSKKSRKYINYKISRKISKSKKSRKSNNSMQKYRKHHRGGFASCNLATVKEPGFNLDALNAIAGLSIPSSSAVIYRPNCRSKGSSSQAMAP